MRSFIKVIFLFSLFLIPSLGFAATYYVSAKGSIALNISDNGAVEWAAATNIATPTNAGTAFARATAGDTVNFRDGTYNIGTNTLNVANSGSADDDRIIFQAYTGETPIINGTIPVYVSSGTVTSSSGITNLVDTGTNFTTSGVLGGNIQTMRTTTAGKTGGALVQTVVNSNTLTLASSSHNTLSSLAVGDTYEIVRDYCNLFTATTEAGAKSYITFDGFTFQVDDGELAEINARGYPQDGITIKNCTFPAVTKKVCHGDNRGFIYISNPLPTPGSSLLIQGNYFGGLDHVKHANLTLNTSAIKIYHTSNTIVENNDIINCVTGIFFKSDVDNSIIRYNYINGGSIGVDGITITPGAGMESDNVQIYHNVLIGTGAKINTSGDSGYHTNDASVFNNTIYSSSANGIGFGYNQSGHGSKLYNNITIVSANYAWTTNDGNGYISNIAEEDHNFWGSPWRNILISYNWGNHYATSLVALKAMSELEFAVDLGCGSNQNLGCGDVSDTAGNTFANTSGNLNQLADFALKVGSLAKEAGRDGVDMGADVTIVGTGNEPPSVSLATVSTTEASSITSNSASSGGNVTDDGDGTVSARGVCWGTSTNPTTANSHTTDGQGTGEFTSSLTSLSSDTTYYYRAYATNEAGTAYGSNETFDSLAATTSPTVTTTAISDLAYSSATSGGNVTDDGGETVTARGVCWSIYPNPTTTDSKTSDSTGEGVFVSSITGLSFGTTYHVRAYATNANGTSYGADVEFTTPIVKHIVTFDGYKTITVGGGSNTLSW